jgi:hypothetical protein
MSTSMNFSNLKESIKTTNKLSNSTIPDFLKEKDLALSAMEPLDNLDEIPDEKYDSPIYKQYNTNVYLLSSRNLTGLDLGEAIGTIGQNNIVIDFDE